MKMRFFQCLDINDVLQESVSFGLIEPIDDPNQFVVQDDYEFVLGMNTGNEFYRADTGEYQWAVFWPIVLCWAIVL